MIELPKFILPELLAKANDNVLSVHILRNWTRERIVNFATHLLGDECQKCIANKNKSPGIKPQK